MKQTCSEKVAQHKIRVCYVSDCSEISFQMSEFFADCVLNFDYFSVLYTLAFSEKLELLYLRAHWCQRWIWKLKVLSSGCLEDLQSCSTHETDMF